MKEDKKSRRPSKRNSMKENKKHPYRRKKQEMENNSSQLNYNKGLKGTKY
jgi:hypothetical protein